MRTFNRHRWRTTVLACALAITGAAYPAGGPPNPHGSYVEDCTLCHGKDSWKPAVISDRFNHAKSFPLTLAHASVACRSCHETLDFKQAKSNCADCHQDVHRGEFGLDCVMCHTTRNFIERADSARRHRVTRFPLLGAHAILDCSDCHRPSSSGQATFVNTPTECDACHLDDYNATTDPDHAAGGFSRNCEQCHGTMSWSSAAFNHEVTGFPLTGAHRAIVCASCHPGNQFSNASSDCYACHQNQFNQTTDPPHAIVGFATDCRQCHSTSAWIPSSFNHGTTAFPLTGAHRVLTCDACHGGGVYGGLSTACEGCHLNDYNATTDPDHQTAGFPVDCASCHNTNTWSGAKFDHDSTFFPIYSGAHNGKWSACSTCHINSSSYAEFSCFGCHPHSDQAKTDDTHHEVSGYMYESHACYNCHPRGRS